MRLVRTVYDQRGYIIGKDGSRVTPEMLSAFNIQGIGEIFIEDKRVADVPVQPLIAPELEAQAIQSLRQLLTEHTGHTSVDPILITELENVTREVVRELFPEVIGEVNTDGCRTVEEYPYVQPVRTACMAILLGKRVGYDQDRLLGLAMAAMLKDVGVTVQQGDHDLEADSPSLRQHTMYGAEIIGQYQRFGPEVANAVYQHHEKWDGTGFPDGAKGEDISVYARILALADTYYDLVSVRPGREPYRPNEAMEYIMAYSGENFDGRIVKIMSKNVPLYPAGVMVKLNTGESGVISRNHVGNFSRPVVRVFNNKRGRPRLKPFDVDLADRDFQDQLVVEIMKT